MKTLKVKVIKYLGNFSFLLAVLSFVVGNSCESSLKVISSYCQTEYSHWQVIQYLLIGVSLYSFYFFFSKNKQNRR